MLGSFARSADAQDTYQVQVGTPVVAEIDSLFYGIQYHRNTYGDPVALEKLARLPFRYVRLWAYPSEFHPKPGQWSWDALDAQINEVLAAGYQPIVCIFQAEDWYTGTPEQPWWNDADARAEWAITVEAVAARYHDVVDWWILFDEINYLNPNAPYYMSFQQSVDLYLEAVSQLRAHDPQAHIGGPSGFAGWENGHWAANYVLNHPDGAAALDFVSSNIFLSWDGNDSDATIMDRTIWYEEAATKMREMIGTKDDPLLVLDAYNASALWTIDGNPNSELWTDPRNVNTFGGVYQTAALLHAAKGGFDMTLRWETLGGYGILRWYPAFNEQAPYYAFQLLAGPGGLQPGSHLVEITTTESPKTDLPHHSGQQAAGYHVQPFAVQQGDTLSIILINKYAEPRQVDVTAPTGYRHYDLFRFDANRHVEAIVPLTSGQDDVVGLALPGLSVTVLRYHNPQATTTASSERVAASFTLHPAYPNPAMQITQIPVDVPRAARLSLTVHNILGQQVATRTQIVSPGSHTFTFDVSRWTSGLYLYRVQVDDQVYQRTVLVVN